MAPSCFRLKSSESKKEEERSANLLENGRMLLEETIASCDGKCKQPIRTFSLKDLQEATNNFNPDRILHHEGFWLLYKGILVGNRPVYVKKYKQTASHEEAITGIVIGSQMSAHNNVLKLIGCCVESVIPMVVYQFVADWFTLHDYIFASSSKKGLQPLPWKSRIKIAMSTANAIAHLHTALVRPVVHRDIKPGNIMMDGNNMIPKLHDFSLSVSIPEGETHVEREVAGTFGFVDPKFITSGLINESSDVYGFGVLLLTLLTAKNAVLGDKQGGLVEYVVTCIENDRFKECLDPSIVAEESSSWLEKEAQICKFRELALKCVSKEPEDRPTMIEVGKELTRIYQSLPSLVNYRAASIGLSNYVS